MVMMFFIEVAFQFNDGGSLGFFFTQEFITNFIFHELMIVFYFVVFIVVFLMHLLLIKLDNNRNNNK